VFDVDADDALRASQPSTLHCHETHWSAAKDRDRLATLQLRPIDCRVSGRQNVGKEKHISDANNPPLRAGEPESIQVPAAATRLQPYSLLLPL
jgi:hypothetical protein